MSQTRQDWLQKHAITHIECLIPDLNGLPRGKLVPVSHYPNNGLLRFPQVSLLQTLMGDPQQQLVPECDPDMVLQPDDRSLALKPGNGRNIAQLIHDCHYEDGRMVPFAPRSVLQHVLQQYRQAGLHPQVAPEIEFYLLNSDGLQTETTGPAYSLDHAQRHEGFFAQLEQHCHLQGIATDTLLHEVGNGQYELNLQHGDALALADQVFLLKRTLRTLASEHGMKACFMAKPFSGQAGSAMHIHQSLLDESGRNVFSRDDGDEHPRFRHYIAGLQQHLPSAMALMAPNPNSYRRLAANTAAPINVEWGYDNRSCGLRVPASPPRARRVENRLPGIDCNPYLALATTLACGLLGLQAEQPATPPLQGSAYDKQAALPQDLAVALDMLDSNQPLQQVLGSEFVGQFIAIKRLELADFQQQITAWERNYLLEQA
ncbi:glutamine synthetase family protein [Vogesella oryzae]|uniref:glutamine synthetase family protein n=1 Tax=Vogesella oryzae TaxID=1735285 RepID=UPI001583E865|nr:glutamine synthetase family protein [Vogesella oryzae]